MAIAFSQSLITILNTNSGTTATGKFTAAVSAGKFVVVIVKVSGGNFVNSISDPRGNTWVNPAYNSSSGPDVEIWYSFITTGIVLNDLLTVTANAGSAQITNIIAASFTGVGTFDIFSEDLSTGALSGTSASATTKTISLGTTRAPDLIIAATGTAGAGSQTFSSSTGTVLAATDATKQTAMVYQVQGARAAASPVVTWSAATTFVYAGVAFFPAGTALTKTQTGISRIANNKTTTQTGVSRIAQNYTKTQPAISGVANNLTKTQSAIARIANNYTKTQSAVANIVTATLNTKTQTGISRISQNYTKTQSGISKIANNRAYTQLGTARIVQNYTKTQTGISRIANSLTKTQTGIARISQSKTLTQSAISRIAISKTLTQSGTAKIASSFTKTQTGKSRISVIQTKTQPAISRIAQTYTKTQTGKSAMVVTSTKTQSGKASILTNIPGPTKSPAKGVIFLTDGRLAVKVNPSVYQPL